MAYTKLVLQTTVRAGLTPAYVAAVAGGHAFDNDSKRVFLHVKNGHSATITLTIGPTYTVDGRILAARTVEVPASEERIIGPFSNVYYGEDDVVFDPVLALDYAVTVDYDVITALTIAAVVLGDI